MRALIRNEEVWEIPQTMQESEIVWQSTKFPNGNSYAYCSDCPEDAIASDFDISERTEEIGEDEGKRVITRLYAILNQARYDQRKSEETSDEPKPVQSTPVEEQPVEQPAEALPETVSIGGKEYTLDELKKLIE